MTITATAFLDNSGFNGSAIYTANNPGCVTLHSVRMSGHNGFFTLNVAQGNLTMNQSALAGNNSTSRHEQGWRYQHFRCHGRFWKLWEGVASALAIVSLYRITNDIRLMLRPAT